jgi:hypothetical protein
MSGSLLDPTQPLPFPSGQQPVAPAAPAAPMAPGAPAAAPQAGAFAQQQALIQQILAAQQAQQARIPGMVGMEQAALNDVMKLYGQKPAGPDPALMQLAAGFFAPTKTGSLGESIGTATQGYAGALSRQQEQNFDRATKLAQLKLTQAQLANKLPQMQMEGLKDQLGTVSAMTSLEEKGREAEQRAQQRKAVEDMLRANGSDYTPEQLAELRATPPDKIPEKIAQMRRDGALTDKGIETFTSLGKDLQSADNLAKSFKPVYAGKGIGVIGGVRGAAENLMGRQGKNSAWNGDEGGADRVGQAEWWMQYQTWKSKVRNELYGAALTPGERADFDKQEVSPSDGADVVTNKLARQQEIVKSAIERTRDSYTAQGKSRKAIDAALGFTPGKPANAGQGGDVPDAPRDPTQRKVGQRYKAPNGTYVTWNGTGWEAD